MAVNGQSLSGDSVPALVKGSEDTSGGGVLGELTVDGVSLSVDSVLVLLNGNPRMCPEGVTDRLIFRSLSPSLGSTLVLLKADARLDPGGGVLDRLVTLLPSLPINSVLVLPETNVRLMDKRFAIWASTLLFTDPRASSLLSDTGKLKLFTNAPTARLELLARSLIEPRGVEELRCAEVLLEVEELLVFNGGGRDRSRGPDLPRETSLEWDSVGFVNKEAAAFWRERRLHLPPEPLSPLGLFKRATSSVLMDLRSLPSCALRNSLAAMFASEIEPLPLEVLRLDAAFSSIQAFVVAATWGMLPRSFNFLKYHCKSKKQEVTSLYRLLGA